MRRRLLGILLAVVLAVGMIPATALTAFATDSVPDAMWGGDKDTLSSSGTFAEAIDAAEKGNAAYVQLQKGITLSTQMDITSGTFTIDLNGQKIAIQDGTSLINVKSGANVTFADSGGGGGITSSTGIAAIAVEGVASSVIFNGGEYESSGNAAVLIYSGSVVVKDGSFKGNKRAIDNTGGTLRVEDGTFAAKVNNGDAISSSSKTIIADGGFVGRVVYHDGELVFSGNGTWSEVELFCGADVSLNGGIISLPVGCAAVDEDGNVATNALSDGKKYHFEIVYTVAVSNDGNGAASASPAFGVGGTEVELTATPNEGYQFKEWQVTSGSVTITDNKFTMPASNVTVTATFKARECTITFVTDGGTTIDPIKQDYGTAITAPADPTKEGYTFAGWDKEIPATMPAEDVTITAKWTANTHDVVYMVDGVEYERVEDVPYGTAVTPIEAPAKTGYTFSGWSAAPATMPDEDITITGSFTINEYAITFDTGGGTAIDPITQDYGTAITAPADPTKEGYTFAGWDKEIPTTMPAENLTITAKWNSNYVPAPTYPPAVEDAKGGEVSVSTPNPSVGDKVTVSAKPAIGFEIGDVTVTDKDGNPVEVTVNEDGTYSFTQPSGAVNVEVSFALAGSGCQGDDGCVISGFSDAGTGSWYHEGVCWALNSGILRGYDNGLLGPTNVTTRAQLFAMLHRLEGEPEAAAGSTFADVDAGAWYAGSIAWAQQMGLALGYGDGSEIGPNDPLTREQLATILYRYAQWKGMDVSASADLGSFADGSDVSSYAASAVEWAVSEGVIRGYDDGSDEIGSKDSAQRGQVATMLMRFVVL